MTAVELWTLDGTDEHYEEVIALLRLVLGVAEEAEVVHPETVSALRQWCNVEYKRIYPTSNERKSRIEEVKAALARSPHARFWEGLQKGDEVRWTGTKSATYFVEDPEPVVNDPDNPRSPDGQYILLRRHSGKTFWSHIAKVRPL